MTFRPRKVEKSKKEILAHVTKQIVILVVLIAACVIGTHSIMHGEFFNKSATSVATWQLCFGCIFVLLYFLIIIAIIWMVMSIIFDFRD